MSRGRAALIVAGVFVLGVACGAFGMAALHFYHAHHGGFSSERLFRIALANGEHIGLAPVEYCYTRQGEPIGDKAPSRATPIDGLVAARILEMEPSGKVLIYVPDGEVLRASGQNSRAALAHKPEAQARERVTLACASGLCGFVR